MVKRIENAYFERMANRYVGNEYTGPWTREWVQVIIKMLMNGDHITVTNWNIHERNIKEIYMIELLGDKKVLMRVLKSSDNTVKTVPVVPWEDSFYIIWNAHLACGHGNITQTMNLIKPNYFINLVFVAELIKICNCQKEKTKADLVHYNIEGSLQILDMTAYQDEKFKYVLIYNDIRTKFVQLRPLTEINELEISLELMKIFTDFGPPLKLVVYDSYFYDNVIDKVNKIFDPCKIELELDVFLSENDSNNRLLQVRKMLSVWMKMNKSMNWLTGCYFVQWKMNTTKNDNKIPHSIVFNNSTSMKNVLMKKSLNGNAQSVIEGSVSTAQTNNDNVIDKVTDSENDTLMIDKDLNNKDRKEYVIEECTNSMSDLHDEQFISFENEFLKYVVNQTYEDLATPLIINSTSNQDIELKNKNEQVANTSDSQFDSNITAFTKKDILNDEILNQNDMGTTTNELIITDSQPPLISNDTHEQMDIACGTAHENIIETTFICWRCEKEVDCNNKIQNSAMDTEEIICESCIKEEENIT